MTEADLRELAQLVRGRPLAALGTLHRGGPNVTLVQVAPAPDLAAFYLHLSRLALHTQDLLANPAAGLMISEAEAGNRNPLTLGRVSLQGEAFLLADDAPEAAAARRLYQDRFPRAAINFTLPDFGLFQFTPRSGRYVAGFGKIFDLGPEALKRAGALAAGGSVASV